MTGKPRASSPRARPTSPPSRSTPSRSPKRAGPTARERPRARAREPTTEPGLPVTAVTFDEAATFCRWAGGRLPTRDELAVAISHDGGRRYPWGDTGAVCRRGAWGLLTGPCATSGSGPDVVASHPDGTSREGVHDLAGNVAEWATPPDAHPDLADVLGGSWQDGEAAALRGWNHRSVAKTTRAATIGFRCVYTSS